MSLIISSHKVALQPFTMGVTKFIVVLLLKNIFIQASDSKVSCDIKNVGFLSQKENGRWNYSPKSEFKFKFNHRNPATREILQNKGRLKRSKGLFVHHDSASGNVLNYSDGWLVCNQNRFAAVHVKCYNNGTLSISDFPICEKIGCDTENLAPYDSRLYNKEDGCKKGYTSDGLEAHGNICRRTCGENISSRRRIRCTCDFQSRSCEYTVKNKIDGAIKWINWQTFNQNQEPLVSSSECFPASSSSTTTTTTATSTTTAKSTTTSTTTSTITSTITSTTTSTTSATTSTATTSTTTSTNTSTITSTTTTTTTKTSTTKTSTTTTTTTSIKTTTTSITTPPTTSTTTLTSGIPTKLTPTTTSTSSPGEF